MQAHRTTRLINSCEKNNTARLSSSRQHERHTNLRLNSSSNVDRECFRVRLSSTWSVFSVSITARLGLTCFLFRDIKRFLPLRVVFLFCLLLVTSVWVWVFFAFSCSFCPFHWLTSPISTMSGRHCRFASYWTPSFLWWHALQKHRIVCL